MGNERNGEIVSRGHYKLGAWKTSRALVKKVYQLTQTFPKEEVINSSAHSDASLITPHSLRIFDPPSP